MKENEIWRHSTQYFAEKVYNITVYQKFIKSQMSNTNIREEGYKGNKEEYIWVANTDEI